MSPVHELLGEFLARYPHQPATALWRAIEITHLLETIVFPPGHWLDVGCGDGSVLEILLSHVARAPSVIGVDSDADEVALALRTGVYSEVIESRASMLPIADDCIDFVFSNSVIEHVDDLSGTLSQIARVLRTGGRFLFTVPSTGFHACLAGPWMPHASRRSYLDALDRRLAHRHYLSADQWRTTLGAAGLRIMRASTYMNQQETARWETISRLTGGLLYAASLGAIEPIRIQRRLGMRRPNSSRMPAPLAKALARVLIAGVYSNTTRPSGDRAAHACLAIEAAKP